MNNKKSKLGYLIPEFPGQTHIFFWRELNAIRDMGIDVQIISTQKNDLNLVKHDFAKPASEQTFYLHPPKLSYFFWCLIHPVWFFRCLKYISSLETRVVEKFKLIYFIIMAAGLLHFCRGHHIKHIHGHSCANVAHILAMASLGNKLTYSLTLHGGLSIYGDSHRQKMQRAAFVSTVTRPLHEEVKQNAGLSPERIPVISMGVDLQKFSPTQRQFDATKPLRFVTIARLSIGKGHEYSLRALQRIKAAGFSFSFTVVGDGPERARVEKEVADLGLQDEVTMLGTLSENEVLSVLENSDLLLLTSFGEFEAAPVCVMEAMASGIPTITSIIGGTRDMVDHNVNGFLVEQRNVDEIEVAMLKFLKDRSLLNTMGAHARQKAEQVFDYKYQAQNLIESIRKFTESL